MRLEYPARKDCSERMLYLFTACVLLVAYTYVLYPLAIGLLTRLWPRPMRPNGPIVTGVSFVMAARNEGLRIAQRIEEFKRQLSTAHVEGEVIVVLDGPDGPLHPALEQAGRKDRVLVLTLPQNQGKAAAITVGAMRSTYEVLAFADVRQHWQDDALRQLLENFRDPRVGAVSGELVLQQGQGVTEGVGIYWKYEKWLRSHEAIVDSVVGATGAISAVRRELFNGVPAGTVLDDVYWPLVVVMRGFRVVYDRGALAFDRLPANANDEFRRKLRTLSGNYQLLTLLPSALLPWKNRIWLQYVSHKLLRLAVPWALLGAVISTGLMNTTFGRILFWSQLLIYGSLLLTVVSGIAGRYRASSAAVSFIMLNVAAWLAFWVWISGNASKSWSSVQYESQGSSDG